MKHSTLVRLGWLLIPVAVVVLMMVPGPDEKGVSNAFAQQGDATATPAPAATATAASDTKSDIDYIMYLRSQPQDADVCDMSVEEGELVIAPGITNPAMTCPDMFAWKILIEQIQQEFWLNWAADQYMFPPDGPLPLCEPGATDRSNCCMPGSTTNPGYDDDVNPGRVCPYFPGDNLDPGDEPNMLESKLPRVQQGSHFTFPEPAEGVETGREIRQSQAEIVFRNKAMFDYLFENDLYNTDGLKAVFDRATAAMEQGAPYHQENQPDGLVSIDLPIGAVMVKTNWLLAERAAEMGIEDDPDNPYIKMTINSKVNDFNAEIFEPGVHYLVGIHISSKDIPNWVWATFEHVNNPGRCDITGCNDSFGYRSPDEVQPGQYTNYIAPKQQSDNLLVPTNIFDQGQIYSGDERNPSLEAIFTALNIGSSEGNDEMPTVNDRGWLSYRLKGSQTTFTDKIGNPTFLGNSVTEGGFESTASCINCHGRAAINAQGEAAMTVFIDRLAEGGYAQSSYGVPNPAWYYTTSSTPKLEALPFDFIWGLLDAKPLATNASDDSASLDSGSASATADPFAYCANAGTINTPKGNFGTSNPGVPQAVATGLKEAVGASADAPLAMFEENSYWRCMNGQVYACFVGANLPCESQADTSTTPTDAMTEYCAANEDADAIPAVVTGRDTVYAWSCVKGEATAGKEVTDVDAQGYQANIWYEIEQ
ncbi:MAG: hypothetical protein KDJ97_13830 [Anaerolineae bacterium]|nr:hypothetical protein [Anaerolineae bacterium]